MILQLEMLPIILLGNLAICYKDAGYAARLIILGKIDSGGEALNVAGSVRVTLELAK